MRVQEGLVTRTLAIEGETVIFLARMADLDHAFAPLDPVQRLRRRGGHGVGRGE